MEGGDGRVRRKIEGFEDLYVWQKAIGLARAIYEATDDGRLSRDFGLRDQLRRASVSISANIAEGYERGTRKDYVRFLVIAKGSAGEVRSLLHLAAEVKLLDQAGHEALRSHAVEVSSYLANLIKRLTDS